MTNPQPPLDREGNWGPNLATDTATPFFTPTELQVLCVLARTAFTNGLIQVSRGGAPIDITSLRALDILGKLHAKLAEARDDALSGKGQIFRTPF